MYFVFLELDFSAYELDDEEGTFKQHLTTLTISLSGSPSQKPSSSSNKQKSKRSSTAFTVSPPHHLAMERLKHKLSLSNTPPVRVGVASAGRSFLQDILTSYTHLLPDAQVGHYSEKLLDINNPYSSDLKWELSNSASPFVRKAGIAKRSGQKMAEGEGGRGEIFKANYSIFWVSERHGTTPPQSTSKVSCDTNNKKQPSCMQSLISSSLLLAQPRLVFPYIADEKDI